MKKKPPQPQNNAQGIQQQSEQQAPAQNTRYMTSDEISIEIQKTKLNIEKSTLIFNKGILLYFSFLFVGIFGFVQGYVSETTLNLLIVLGIMAFIVGAIPYLKTTKQEEKKLTEILEHIKGKRGISPLIATVILIGFAVALGAVVMNWSKAQLNTSGCEKVEIDFEKVAGVAQFCQTNDGKLQYEIVN
ncbi:MAG: archaellin/type IV pilin N-terminal domain-containing protein, partial [Candidatus Woesearchaeota archaeon]